MLIYTMFDMKSELRRHLFDTHKDPVEERHLGREADGISGPVINLSTCPLCPNDLTLVRLDLDDHIAAHLHSFALQVIPLN